MTSANWPHHGKADGWGYDTLSGQVYTKSNKANLPLYAKESRSYLQARSEAVEADIAFRKLLRGKDPYPSSQVEAPPKKKIKSLAMRRKVRARPKRLRRRPRNAALQARRLPFRQVVLVEAITGSVNTGRIEHQFKLSDMAKEFSTTFEELKCTGFSVRFVPNNSTTAEGIYSAILLDQGGFDGSSRPADVWFPRVGDMPGSVVRHCSSGFTLSWRPTEPEARNFMKVHNSELKRVIASLFIYGSTTATVIKGALVIKGSVLCRGEYYSAGARTRRLKLEDQSQLQEMTLNDLAIDE